MKTNTKLASLAAAVALLASTCGLAKAEARACKGQYYIAYQTAPGAIAIHTEACADADQALARFAEAATPAAWLVMMVDEEEAGEVFPLIEYAHHNGTYYVGDRTARTLPEIDACCAYEVCAVSAEVAYQLAERWADHQN